MSVIATKEFLSRLKGIYTTALTSTPSSTIAEEIKNPWYVAAAVAFTASNRPEEVVRVFEFVMDDVLSVMSSASESASMDEKKRCVVRMREALFKGGLISGYARAISSLIALYESTPEELRDTKLIREADNDKISDMTARGDELYSVMFGETTESVKSLLNSIHPDMGWFARTIACGHIFGAHNVLNQRDTSFVLISALIAMDTPIQLRWHLANAQRAGASREEIRAVREIAIQVASVCGMKWRNGIPDVQDTA